MKSFVSSGKKGDLIMSLYIVKAMGGGKLYLKEGEFEEPLENVIESCGKLIRSQEYINSFEIYQGESVDVDLDQFRKSLKLFRCSLLEVMCESQGLEIEKLVGPWIQVPPDFRFESKIVIHRRTSVFSDRSNPLFDWDRLFDLFGRESFVFVSRIEKEWKDFGHPDIAFHQPSDNYEHARILRGSRLYIGNQSFPSALADAVGSSRIFELSTGVDRKHFAVTYAPNAWYFASPWDCTLKNFRYLINGGSSFRDLASDEMTDHMEPYSFDWKKVWACELGYRSEYLRTIAKQALKKVLGRI